MVNHQKQCSCPPGFTGNAEKECFRVPTACQSRKDCPSGHTCQAGVCFLGCGIDSNCVNNEKCVGDKCMCKYILNNKMHLI